MDEEEIWEDFQDDESNLKYQENNNTIYLILLALLILAFIGGMWEWLRTGVWRKPILKSQLAKKYGFKKFEPMTLWIKKFCPQDIVDEYVGTQKQLIVPADLFPYLGNPENYPRDTRNRKIKNKQELARAFNLEHKTISRNLKDIHNLKEQIGMNYEQYKDLKNIPPKYMTQIVAILSEKYVLGGKEKAKLP